MSAWRKSSFSNGTGGNNCVEVRRANYTDEILVRDSKNIHGPGVALIFTRNEWGAFLAGVKAGEFDIEE